MRRTFLSQRFAPSVLSKVSRGAGAFALTKAGTPENEKPIRPSIPAIKVNKVDLFDYGADLAPLIKSFHEQDLLARTLYKDPDALYAAHEKLLYEAFKLDGCQGPTGCQGWGTAESAPPPKVGKSDGTGPTTAENNKAYQKRREASVLFAEFEIIEDIIKARGLTKAQVAKQTPLEVALYDEWRAWLDAYKVVLKSWEQATIVTAEDYREMQRKDVQLQVFRNRFRAVTGLEPMRSYLIPLPSAGSSIPWVPIIVLASAAVGVYALHEANVFAGYFAPNRAPAKAA